MNHPRLIAMLAAAAVTAGALTGCSADPSAGAAGQISQAPAAQAGPGRVDTAIFAAVTTWPGVQIIGVRTPEEFAEGHIQGAMNIPVQQADFAQRVTR